MRFSVGYELTATVRSAILEIPDDAWVVAVEQDGSLRDNGEVAEITAGVELSSWPEGSRLIVRRERPHPGAQLSFSDHDGHRFQAILTDHPGQIAELERRHRARARVEDRIRDVAADAHPSHRVRCRLRRRALRRPARGTPSRHGAVCPHGRKLAGDGLRARLRRGRRRPDRPDRAAIPENKDANDVIWWFDASRDYDPCTPLGAISAPILAVNFADDGLNPPELGGLDHAIAPGSPRARHDAPGRPAVAWAPDTPRRRDLARPPLRTARPDRGRAGTVVDAYVGTTGATVIGNAPLDALA